MNLNDIGKLILLLRALGKNTHTVNLFSLIFIGKIHRVFIKDSLLRQTHSAVVFFVSNIEQTW
jgi:hypothetical protein